MQQQFFPATSFTPKHPILAYFANPSKNNLSTLFPQYSEEILQKLIPLCPQQTTENLHQILINKLPKTDLHVHGEAGFLMDTELARRIAERNGLPFPEDLVDAETTLWKYRGKEDFMQFIKDFLRISELINSVDDIEDIVYSFYKYCYTNNVIFALPGISWVQCKDKISFYEFNQAYNRAIERGMRDFGDVTIWRLRYYQERHVDKETFAQTWEQVKNFRNPLITTIGLAGKEEGFPFSQFIDFYKEVHAWRKVKENTWLSTTAHMEKYSNAKDIEESLKYLDWIAHGRMAADDGQLVARLQQRKIKFELCPLSDTNVYPQEIPSLAQHQQLITLLQAGLVSLNSDDPAFFSGVGNVYTQVAKQLLLNYVQLIACTLNGIAPLSPKSLEEMQEYQPQSYDDYMEIVNLGLLKIQFFHYYWQMLPLLGDIEADLAKQLFALDLKTKAPKLAELYQQIPDNSAIKQAVSLLVQTRGEIDDLSAKVISKTNSMISEFAGRNAETCVYK